MLVNQILSSTIENYGLFAFSLKYFKVWEARKSIVDKKPMLLHLIHLISLMITQFYACGPHTT